MARPPISLNNIEMQRNYDEILATAAASMVIYDEVVEDTPSNEESRPTRLESYVVQQPYRRPPVFTHAYMREVANFFDNESVPTTPVIEAYDLVAIVSAVDDAKCEVAAVDLNKYERFIIKTLEGSEHYYEITLGEGSVSFYAPGISTLNVKVELWGVLKNLGEEDSNEESWI